MKRWLLFALAGAAVCWLLTEPPPRRRRAGGPAERTPEPDAAHQQALLDEALDESFPASDPPSMTVPRH